MAKIVYGVSGEGSGHSSRAREMATHLEKQGHRVKIASYDRGFRNLKDDFDVYEIVGLHIKSTNNRVSPLGTFWHNLKRIPKAWRVLKKLRGELFNGFRPDCVITDFEPMTAYLARFYGLPLISLDNQHRMRYMDYPRPANLLKDRLVTQTVIKLMVPRPDVSLVTSFYHGSPTNDFTFIFPPILRREVLETKPRRDGHFLVYFTNGFDSFLEELACFKNERFLVYGSERTGTHGPLTYKPFSRRGFLADLAGAQAVLATAGFTLMTESLYLKKPLLALPMKGQFEQELNGFLLEYKGFGKNLRRISHAAVADFLANLPAYERALRAYQPADNHAIQNKLDELLDRDGALLKQFQKGRRSFRGEPFINRLVGNRPREGP